MRERPELTLATLRDQQRLGFDPVQRAALAREERERTLAEAHRRIRGAEDRARFEAAVAHTTLAHPIHEENEFHTLSRPAALVREATLAVARRAVLAAVIQESDDVFFLTADEVSGLLTGPDARELVIRRRAEHARARRATPAASYGVAQPSPPLEIIPEPNRWQLTAVAWTVAQIFAQKHARRARGRRRAHRHPGVAGPLHRDGTGRPGRVAVRPDPGRRCAGLPGHVSRVVDPVLSHRRTRDRRRRDLSHPAIIAREFGIPAVVATGTGTTFVRDGDRIEVDGVSGVVRILSRTPEGVTALAAAADLERPERATDVIEDFRRSIR